MRRFLLIVGLLAGSFVLNGQAFAALSAVDVSPGVDDVREINFMTPGSSKTFLGTRLKGPLTTGATTYASGDNGNPAIASGGTAGAYATPTTTVFIKTTGALFGESYLLGDGTYNQRLTAVLVTDGGRDFTITPKTKTGFSNIHLDDAKDSVTLRYINDTVGWTIEGNSGATVN